ncbi:hypothetical protein NC652_005756 [Populus alba x Populus x berolinensis]|nr:hypothetical protein NC652_005756 [Populus alba x Populus x berolinensis]
MDEFGVLKACRGQFRPMKKSVAENEDSTRRLEEQSRETVWFSFQFFQFFILFISLRCLYCIFICQGNWIKLLNY